MMCNYTKQQWNTVNGLVTDLVTGSFIQSLCERHS